VPVVGWNLGYVHRGGQGRRRRDNAREWDRGEPALGRLD